MGRDIDLLSSNLSSILLMEIRNLANHRGQALVISFSCDYLLISVDVCSSLVFVVVTSVDESIAILVVTSLLSV